MLLLASKILTCVAGNKKFEPGKPNSEKVQKLIDENHKKIIENTLEILVIIPGNFVEISESDDFGNSQKNLWFFHSIFQRTNRQDQKQIAEFFKFIPNFGKCRTGKFSQKKQIGSNFEIA